MAAAGRGRATARRRRIAAGVVFLLVGGLSAGTLALAQDGDAGGLFARLDFSAGLMGETGAGSSEDLTAIAGLSFGFDSITRAKALRLRAGADLEVDGDGARLARPQASLAHVLSSRATELRFDAAYAQIDLDETTIEDILTGENFVSDAGRRTTISAAANLITGREAPFGTETALSWSRRDYVDTVGSDFVPATTTRASIVLRFDVTPTATLRLFANQERIEEEDAVSTDRTRSALGLGADLALDRAWTLSADVAGNRIVTLADAPVPGPRIRTETEGLSVRLGLTRDLSNGALSFGLRREVDVTGNRLIFDIGRDLTLREGALSASLGVVRFDGGDLAPVATLDWSQKLTPTSSLKASLSQRATLNEDDEDILSTRVSLGYQQQITEISSWTASMGYAESNVQGGDGDQRRIDFGLGYRRSLTRDWDLAAGLSHQLTHEDGTRVDNITRLTLNVARSFTFRP